MQRVRGDVLREGNAVQHEFDLDVRWTGNLGDGTSGYRSYSRSHSIDVAGLPTILGSSDRHFHGDATRHNPELLLLAAVSECHMLTYLHLASVAGIVVTAYSDKAHATLVTHPDGSGEITLATLHPRVVVADGANIRRAEELHDQVPSLCFISRSVSFPIEHEPEVTAA